MKERWFGIGLLGIVLFGLGCANNKAFFRNKILIYDQEAEPMDEPHAPMLNSSYIDFHDDTINKIDHPFNPIGNNNSSRPSTNKSGTSSHRYIIQNMNPYSSVPFKFSKIGKSVYITYKSKGQSIKKEYFRISNKDSVETSTFDFLCDANTSYNWVVTRYTGRDTVLRSVVPSTPFLSVLLTPDILASDPK